jgi:hypothetical protein
VLVAKLSLIAMVFFSGTVWRSVGEDQPVRRTLLAWLQVSQRLLRVRSGRVSIAFGTDLRLNPFAASLGGSLSSTQMRGRLQERNR